MTETRRTRKLFFAFAAVILITMVWRPANAFRLPSCTIEDEERSTPAEDVLSSYRNEYDNLAGSVDITRIEDHRRNPKIRLSKSERRAAKEYDAIMVKIKFWEDVDRFKGSLAALHGANPERQAVTEADAIAKDVIETLYSLSQKWRIGSSALFTNFLINTGFKEKGFCYHYVAALKKKTSERDWSKYQIRWGTAWEHTYRENNALVITAKGKPFEEGIAVDAWRTAGRPFWTPVKGDRFPWVEAFNVEEKYDVE